MPVITFQYDLPLAETMAFEYQLYRLALESDSWRYDVSASAGFC
ncbi:MAG: hypothetical protein ACXVIO_01630 [Candidatus Angelobacter sp.]